jgi:hypothetical protein
VVSGRASQSHYSLDLKKRQVWLCGALDILHNIALCHTLYTVTVTKYGNPEALLIPPLSLGISILLSGFIGPLQQVGLTWSP